MIIVKILGGMGNQMFQIAAAKALAYRTGMKLKMDTRSLRAHNERGLDLDRFISQADEASRRDYDQLGYPVISKSLIRFKIHPSYYLEKDFIFNPDVTKIQKSVYLDGYFQSEKYFSDVSQNIRNDFTFKDELSAFEIECIQNMQSSESVSLHIRRGDYLNNSQIGTLDLKYYDHALEDLIKKNPSPKVFVFSDDLVWAEKNLKLPFDMIFVKSHTGRESFRDMRLMSQCRNNIIANSSFSWWAAWLNANPEKRVYAPLNWFKNPTMNVKDLIPVSWKKISF